MATNPSIFQRVKAALVAGIQTLRNQKEEDKKVATAHAVSVGLTPGFNLSNHYRETENNRGWVYVAVHTAAKMVSSATITVYDPKRSIQKAFAPDAPTKQESPDPNHHIAKLLKRPNTMVSGSMFLYQVSQQIRLTGCCLIWEEVNAFGIPVRLWVIPRAWCTFQPANPQYPEGYYRVQPVSGAVNSNYFSVPNMAGFFLDARLVIRVYWPSPMYPGESVSPLSACSMIIDIADEQDTATFSAYQNAPSPTLHINIDGSVAMTPEQRDMLQQQLAMRNAGSINSGRPLVTQNAEVSPLGVPLSELNQVEARNNSRENIFGVQQITQGAAGVTEQATYASFVASIKQTTELSVQPELDLIASVLTHRWQKIYGDDFRIQMDAKNCDDPQVTLAQTQAKIQSGVYTDNEIRAAFGDGPIEGGDVTPAQKAEQARVDAKQQAEMMAAKQAQQIGQPVQPDKESDAGKLEQSDYAKEQTQTVGTGKLTGIKRPELAASSGNRMLGLNGKN